MFHFAGEKKMKGENKQKGDLTGANARYLQGGSIKLKAGGLGAQPPRC